MSAYAGIVCFRVSWLGGCCAISYAFMVIAIMDFRWLVDYFGVFEGAVGWVSVCCLLIALGVYSLRRFGFGCDLFCCLGILG